MDSLILTDHKDLTSFHKCLFNNKIFKIYNILLKKPIFFIQKKIYEVTFVILELNPTFYKTNWRQPCNTKYNLLKLCKNNKLIILILVRLCEDHRIKSHVPPLN